MSSPMKTIRSSLMSLNLRERIMLLGLLGLVVTYGAGLLLETLYLEPNRELMAAVSGAEEQVQHHRRLLAREEQIHAQYQKLESPMVVIEDSEQTETEVLRELSELSGSQVRVRSVVPRLGHHEGVQVMFVALDFEGPFDAVVGYVEQILDEMPSEISNLSLAPRSGTDGGVMCSMSIRVGGFGT